MIYSDSGNGASAGPGPVRIAVDLLGGDHAPAVVVDGALRSCCSHPDVHPVLVGTRPAADEILARPDGAAALRQVRP